MSEHLILSTKNELVRIASESISCITSDGNYSHIHFTDSRPEYTIVMQLGQIAELINKQLVEDGHNFIRIGRQLIINRNYIYQINLTAQTIKLSDKNGKTETHSATREALKGLKNLIEKEGY